MKIFSRLIALLLSFIMVFALASCDEKTGNDDSQTTTKSNSQTTAPAETGLTQEEYENLFNAASEKIVNLEQNGISAALDAKVSMTVDGSVINIPITASVALEAKDGKLAQFLAGLNVSYLGNVSAISFYTDGVNLYSNENGYKTYTPVEEGADLTISNLIAELKSEIGAEDALTVPDSITEYLQNNIEIKYDTVSDNVYTASVTLTEENMTYLLRELVTAMSGIEETDETEGADEIQMIEQYLEAIKLHATTVEVTLDNNQKTLVLTCSTSFDADNFTAVTEDPESSATTPMTYSVEITVTVDHLGEAVTVTAPADLDTYEEATTGEDDLYYQCMFECYDLFDENFEVVENYEEIYNSLVETYGQEMVDQVLHDIAESFASFEE